MIVSWLLFLILSRPSFGLDAVPAAAWVVPWDPVSLAPDSPLDCFDEINPFVFALDREHRVSLAYPKLAQALFKRGRPGQLNIPVVVNDVIDSGGKVLALKSISAVSLILASPQRISAHVAELVKAAEGFDGIEVDYERVPYPLWGRYIRLLEELAVALHARGLRLHVDLEAGMLYGLGEPYARRYWPMLAAHADRVKLMCYYERGAYSDAVGPGNSLVWVERTASKALELIPAAKLSLALSLSGSDWQVPWPKIPGLRRMERLHYGRVLALADRHRSRIVWDHEKSSPYFTYTRKNTLHEVWFEDERSFYEKIKAVRTAGVQNVSLWYLGAKHPDLESLGLCRGQTLSGR
ncbi:MAG: hypothetical protein HY549_02940 [Elusimicrobia bacterium]|nr:hypothetical protein [Elusimicrobiota bacterium]